MMIVACIVSSSLGVLHYANRAFGLMILNNTLQEMLLSPSHSYPAPRWTKPFRDGKEAKIYKIHRSFDN